MNLGRRFRMIAGAGTRRLLLAVSLTLTGMSAAEPGMASSADVLKPSPRATFGRLENGLRYAILPNNTPAGVVSLRLKVLVGSLHESEKEKGFAHFVEHMAFNGTRRYPPGQLIREFQAAGITFGPHANAYTTQSNTLYRIELPSHQEQDVADALGVLRDFADGILFEPREVRQERRVIESEMLARRSSERTWTEALNAFLYKGTLIPERPVLGTLGVVKRATREQLRSFYDDWYRPERMIIVITGNVDSFATRALIEQGFGDLKARGSARSAPSIGALPPDALRVGIHGGSRGSMEVSLHSVSLAPAPADTLLHRDTELRVNAALAMLRERLRRIAALPNAAVSEFVVRHDRPHGQFVRVYLTAIGPTERWRDIITLVETESRRALEHGFHETELEIYRRSMEASIEAAAREVSTLTSPELADELVLALETGRNFQLADEEESAKLAAVRRLSPAECTAALRNAWQAGKEALFIGVDSRDEHRVRDVAKVFRSSRQARVAPPTPLLNVAFAYESSSEPARVVDRNYVADLGIWRVTLSNGIRLNIKSTNHERSKVHFSIRIGTGRLAEPRELPGLALWAGAGWIYGGLGRHTVDEIVQTLNGRIGGFRATVQDDALAFVGYAAPAHLDHFLAIATAYIRDAAFSPSAKEKVRNQLAVMYSDFGRSAVGPTQRAILPFLSGHDPRFGVPGFEVLAGQRMTDLRKWLGPQLQRAYIEVAVVGDIAAEQAIALVAGSLGTLPERQAKDILAAKRHLELPQPPATRRFLFPTEVDRPATVALYWPVRDAMTLGERRKLLVLSEVLADRIRVKVREQLGSAYSPRASYLESDVYPRFAHLRCELQIHRGDARRVLAISTDLAHTLARGGMREDEAARARAQYISQAHRTQQTNQYWLEDVLSDLQERPERLEEARSLVHDFEHVAKAELDALAARYLTPRNLFRFIVYPD